MRTRPWRVEGPTMAMLSMRDIAKRLRKNEKKEKMINSHKKELQKPIIMCQNIKNSNQSHQFQYKIYEFSNFILGYSKKY